MRKIEVRILKYRGETEVEEKCSVEITKWYIKGNTLKQRGVLKQKRSAEGEMLK